MNGRSGQGVLHILALFLGHLYERHVRRVGQPSGPFVWPQATSGPKPLVSDLLPRPMIAVKSSSNAPRRNSLLPKAATRPAHVQLVPQVHVTLTRQQRLDQALIQVANGVARCLTIACQGLQEQRNESLSEAGVRPAYTQHQSPQGHPGGDPNDSTSSAVAQGHRAHSSVLLPTQALSPVTPLCLPPHRGMFPQQVHKLWAAMLCRPLEGCSIHKAP